MIVSFVPNAWHDYLEWQASDDKTLKKINGLIKEIQRYPFRGIGKPEPLQGILRGYWSRRITGEHRLVYRVFGEGKDQTLRIIQCKFHY